VLFFVKEFIVNPIFALDTSTHSPKNHSDYVIPRAGIETFFPGLVSLPMFSKRANRLPYRKTRFRDRLNKLCVQHWRIWFDSG
jgi:hypothetical protein